MKNNPSSANAFNTLVWLIRDVNDTAAIPKNADKYMIKPTHWRPEALKADANAVSASKSYKGWSPVIEIAINI